MNSILPTPEKFKLSHLPSLLWTTAKKWNAGDVWQLSAAVAYYAILSLPGLMVIMIKAIGLVWDAEIASGKLTTELASLIGYDAADDINDMLQAAQTDTESWWAYVIGFATLVFGATGVFYQLQLALNKIWNLKINPNTPWYKMVTDRAKSLGFILVLGFLILISFLMSIVIGFLQDWITENFADYLGFVTLIINYLISLGIISVLFTLMFRFLPDARVEWKFINCGAIITALLFQTGKFLLEFYFSNSSPASAYGAAGLVVLLLLWVSYSCLILFYGAYFIKVFANRYGDGIRPSSKALKFAEELIVTASGDEVTDEDLKAIIKAEDNNIQRVEEDG
ncbi:MAG: YihY/virulence factor BrkB family protein [Nonlabens sp.]